MSPEEIKFWEEVNAVMAAQEIPVPVIEHRFYYDELGDIVGCSMQNHPESGNYIVVDKSIYNTYFLYTVVDGKLVKKDPDNKYRVLLKRGTKGHCVVKNHAGLILEENETAQETEYYEYKNN